MGAYSDAVAAIKATNFRHIALQAISLGTPPPLLSVAARLCVRFLSGSLQACAGPTPNRCGFHVARLSCCRCVSIDEGFAGAWLKLLILSNLACNVYFRVAGSD